MSDHPPTQKMFPTSSQNRGHVWVLGTHHILPTPFSEVVRVPLLRRPTVASPGAKDSAARATSSTSQGRCPGPEREYILFLSVSGGRSGSRWPVAGGQWPVAGSRSGSRWPVAGGRCPVRWPVAGPVAGARCGIAGAGVGGPFNPPSSVGPFPCSDSDLLEFLT